MHDNEFESDEPLVAALVSKQFPEHAHLPIRKIIHSGSDHAIFRLGKEYAVRLPRIPSAEEQMMKEQLWLPKFSALPLTIPIPIANGKPSNECPYHWYIYNWIEGRNSYDEKPTDLCQAAGDLAMFIRALWKIDTTDAPVARRGLPLISQNDEVVTAIQALKGAMDMDSITDIWQETANTPLWNNPPVWLHGDLLPSNLLVQNGTLHAVIDFGLAGIGDPACDLIPAWSLFDTTSRAVFKDALAVDANTWERGKGWALSIALIIIPYYLHTNPVLVSVAKRMIDEILGDYVFVVGRKK